MRIADRAGGVLDAVSYDFGMLDVVGGGVDDPGHDRPVGWRRALCQDAVLVRVPRVGHGQDQPAHAGGIQVRREVLQRHVEDVRSLVVAPAHMQANPVRRHVAQRAIQSRDGDIHEVEELGQRTVGEQAVALHCEVRAIDLQHHPARDDRLVLGAQRLGHRIHVVGERAVVGVLHRAGDDAGRGRRPERFDEARGLLADRVFVVAQLGVEKAAVGVAHLADGARRRRQQALLRPRLEQLGKAGKGHHVAYRRTLALAAEAAHAVADVGEEALARLLAVVADVDAALELAGDAAPGRLPHGCRDSGRLDRLAAAHPQLQLHQWCRPRQASGVRGQDPRFAALHGSPLIREGLYATRDPQSAPRLRLQSTVAQRRALQGIIAAPTSNTRYCCCR